MTNILGGGGGNAGFHHLLEHLGPASQAWAKDMQAHAFGYDSEGIENLEKSVREWLEKVDAAKIEAQRDELLMELVHLKKETEEGSRG